MSKTVKTAGIETPTVATEIPFEDALRKLNAIVEAMENDELPLEKLLAHYEDGMRMHQLCQGHLAKAELRIQQIERDAAGRLSAKAPDLARERAGLPETTQL